MQRTSNQNLPTGNTLNPPSLIQRFRATSAGNAPQTLPPTGQVNAEKSRRGQERSTPGRHISLESNSRKIARSSSRSNETRRFIGLWTLSVNGWARNYNTVAPCLRDTVVGYGGTNCVYRGVEGNTVSLEFQRRSHTSPIHMRKRFNDRNSWKNVLSHYSKLIRCLSPSFARRHSLPCRILLGRDVPYAQRFPALDCACQP